MRDWPIHEGATEICNGRRRIPSSLKRNLRVYAHQELKVKQQDRLKQKGREVFRSGSLRGGAFREVRRSEPLSCRRLIEIVVIGEPLGVDEQYRNFAQYMVEYLGNEEEKYNKDQEEAINCLAQMQEDRGKRSNPE